MTFGAPYISSRTDPQYANVGKGLMVDVEMIFHAGGSQTGNQLSVTEITWGPGQHSRPHVHHRENEGFYLIDGAMTLTIPGLADIDVSPGQFVWSPIGLPHRYTITGASPARVLVFGVPGVTLGHFFEDIADGRAAVIDTDELEAAYNGWSLAEYGIEFLDEEAAKARTAILLKRHPELSGAL